MSLAPIETDIAIVGAGVAGCVAAIALAPTYRVVLIDRNAQPQERIGECLPPAAHRILRQLGLSQAMDTERDDCPHRRAMGMHTYWGSDEVVVTDYLRNPDGFGWHLDRREFEALLRRSAVTAGVTAVWQAELIGGEDHQTHWRLQFMTANRETREIHARYVIDAAGRNAPFAKKQGVKREHLDRLVACWATIPNQSRRAMGLIAAAEDGWWYSAPLPNGRRVLAFQTDSDLIDAELHKSPAAFMQLARTNEAVARELPASDEGVQLHGIVPANSSRLNQPAGRNWAALGDAATGFDPLSSQGMFHAMASAMQLSQLIQQSKLIEDPSEDRSIRLQIQYSSQIDEIWSFYLNHRRFYYAQEAHRRQGTFWRRRADAAQTP